jgi:osmotically inducible protein OsmC
VTTTPGSHVTPLYTAVAHASGDGRNGHVSSDDGGLDLDVRVPPELGGPGGGTNPEELFAAGYAACFHSALKFAARAERVDVSDSAVSATVGIGVLDAGGFGLTVQLDVHLPGHDRGEGQALVERAHQTCPYSNAIRGNVEVTLSLVD